MENGRVFLLSCVTIIVVSLSADLWTTVEAKFSLSSVKSDLFSGSQLHSTAAIRRSLGDLDPCAKYGDGHTLPAGHPCASSFESVGVIPRLIGVLKKGDGKGKHPPGVGRHPPGIGKHPPGRGKHPPGTGKRPPGIGKRPPRLSKDPRCRKNVSLCLDPKANPLLATDPTATTCCRTKCVSLTTGSKSCGACGVRCRKSKGGPDCCGSTCVDKTTDPNNCGSCGNVCKGTEFCVAGVCGTY